VSAPHLYRSELLGEAERLVLPQGEIDVFTRGSGPTIVFAHGWLANANLWRGVVDALAGSFRCVVLDLPFGAHRVPIGGDADLSAEGCGALIASALEALEVDGAALVGNDSGGAYSQIALSGASERVARLVLTSCETPWDEFPPPPFHGLPRAAQSVEGLRELLAPLEDNAVRELPVAFGLLVKHPLERVISDRYALPCLRDHAVLADTAAVMAGASTEAVHRAGRMMIERWQRPALFAWSHEDPVFPIAHARRYADALADAQIVEIEDCYSFRPEDQPSAVAAAIADFAAG
jgi:pimeloyl-ACP methyl ester carboxylesterase